MANKNFKQWQVLHYVWDDIDDFKNRWNTLPGIHTIQFGDGESPIDIYVNEHINSSDFKAQPVFFTGAISSRGDKKGPFFSGLGLTNNKKLPLVAIADPSLDDDVSLSLAWYTGGPNDNFTANLLATLSALQESLNRELIFIGGSGGGFAALNVASRFKGDSTALVWNPQTDLYEYAERFVKAYLRSRFNFAFATLGSPDWKQYCKSRTDSKVPTNVLRSQTLTTPRRLIYLQNSADWHRSKHLLPLWSLTTQKELQEGINSLDGNHVVFVSEFAEGHAPPPSSLIASLLEQLMDTAMNVKDLVFQYPNSK
ncbi:hypothetical protein [Glutamicibacter mysorens]|uniref:hypothetical protein n=1 Tax=Glutamicibacter mysorens TaxID=257984 RepID=UPI0020C6DCE7|nr:hypothetical protein [Glutamicibacter mysorens]UTM47509.1 hypothetical protein XH9_01395 [Glutamicibacter mysorens]